MIRSWEWWVLDPAGQRKAQIYPLSDDIVLRDNDIDTGVLELGPGIATELLANRAQIEAVVFDEGTDSDVGASVIFGPILSRARRRSGDINSWLFGFASGDVWLAARNAEPDPLTAYPPPANKYATAYAVRSGVASTVLRDLVDVNVGPSALAARRQLTLGADPVAGSSITVRARWANLLTMLAEHAASAGLSFAVRNGVFKIWVPEDKTVGLSTVTFSADLGTLGDFEWSEHAPQDKPGNYTVAAGGGEGTDRLIAEQSDAVSDIRWGRFEAFLDRRQQTTVGELAASIDAARLPAGGAQITPIETNKSQWRRHWNISDRVTVDLDGATVVDTITQIAISHGADGEDLRPVIGAGNALDLDPYQLAKARIADQLRRLEATL